VVEDLRSNDAAGPDLVVHRLSLRGVAAARIPHGPDGGYAVELLRASAVGDLTAGEQLGRALAGELLELGAGVLSGPEA
jgi:hydroxymethylbilane synthase